MLRFVRLAVEFKHDERWLARKEQRKQQQKTLKTSHPIMFTSPKAYVRCD